MAPLTLTIAKNRRIGYLLDVKKRIEFLKKVCDDSERQDQGWLATATARLARVWQRYECSQQDVLGFVAEDEVVDEQVTFTEMGEA